MEKSVLGTDFFVHLVTGGLAAGISKTVVAPLDRIKMLGQLGNTLEGLGENKGPIAIAKYVLREQGVASFWRGNFTNVVRYFPTQAFNFAFKERYDELLGADRDGVATVNPLHSVISGGLAGGTTEIFVYPLDFVRTRLVADMAKKDNERKYKSIWNCLSVTYKTEGGFRGLYRGFWITLAGIIPYRAFYFGGFDYLKRKFLNSDSKKERYLFIKRWAIAQFNTTVAQLIIYPLDTVKRILIIQGHGSHGVWSCATKLFQREGPFSTNSLTLPLTPPGLPGFYKGATANIARATGGALCISIYDTIKDFIHKKKQQQNKLTN